MSRRIRSANNPTVKESVEQFLIHRHDSKNLRVEVSLLAGPRSGKVVGKQAAAPALAVEHGALPVRRLTPEAIAQWESRRSGGQSHNYRRQCRFILRHYLRFGVSRGWWPEAILDDFPALPKQDVRREWLRPNQAAFLLQIAAQALDDYQHFAVLTFLQTGVRASELPKLKLTDLNDRERTLTVLGKGRGDGKLRKVKVSRAFIAAWHAHASRYEIPPGGYVFFQRRAELLGGPNREWEWVTNYRKPASVRVFSHIFDDPASEPGAGRGKLTSAIMEAQRNGTASADEIPHCAISPVVLRRTYACLFLILGDAKHSQGQALMRLQKYMGHEDFNTTKLYLADVVDYLDEGDEGFDVTEAIEAALAWENRRQAG